MLLFRDLPLTPHGSAKILNTRSLRCDSDLQSLNSLFQW